MKLNYNNLSKKEIRNIVETNKGRLATPKSRWTLEEAQTIASLYKTRGELFTKNQNLYLNLYNKGLLDQICANMKPSRKKNRFVRGVLNPNTALANIFNCNSHQEFLKTYNGAYNALVRYGVDTQELFDNKDDFNYIKALIVRLAGDSVTKMVEDASKKTA